MNLSQKFLQKLDESTETKLSSPKVEKLSIVDQPANQEEFLFAKNTDMNKELEKALNDAVASLREVNEQISKKESGSDGDLFDELEGQLEKLFSSLDKQHEGEGEGEGGSQGSQSMGQWSQERALSVLRRWQSLEGSPSDQIQMLIDALTGEGQNEGEGENSQGEGNDQGENVEAQTDSEYSLEDLAERVDQIEEGMEKMDEQFAEFLSQLTGEEVELEEEGDVEKQSRLGEWILENFEDDEDAGNLAAAVGRSESTIDQIISGDITPSRVVLEGIADFFGVEPDTVVEQLPEGEQDTARERLDDDEDE